MATKGLVIGFCSSLEKRENILVSTADIQVLGGILVTGVGE
jgi:hypothetical protein